MHKHGPVNLPCGGGLLYSCALRGVDESELEVTDNQAWIQLPGFVFDSYGSQAAAAVDMNSQVFNNLCIFWLFVELVDIKLPPLFSRSLSVVASEQHMVRCPTLRHLDTIKNETQWRTAHTLFETPVCLFSQCTTAY